MKRLIIEYLDKIALCRDDIDSINKALTYASKSHDDDMMADLLTNRKIIETRRECYIQFIKDLETT